MENKPLPRTWSNMLDLSDEDIREEIRTATNIQASPQNFMDEVVRRDNVRLANSQLQLAAKLGRATNAILIFTVVIAVCTVVILGITIWQFYYPR